MDRLVLDSIVREVEGYIENDTTRLWENEAQQQAGSYIDLEWMDKERALLRTNPVIVGHSSKIKNRGDYFTHDATGMPIIVVRQADGSVRALLNICSHRGARLCTKHEGNNKVFVCPYHAWTYQIDGALRGIPREEGFPNIHKSQHGLQELPVEERHGFIWVIPTVGAKIDVAQHLGALDAELASFGSAKMLLEREEYLTAEMNWKFVLDGFLETYHFPVLHAKSIAPYFYANYSPFESFGLNGRMVGVRSSFEKLRGKPTDSISSEELMKHFAFNYFIFPNTILVWQGDHFESWTSFPGARADQSLTHVQSVVTQAMAGPEFKDKWSRNWEIMIGTVVNEDWAMSTTIQQSIHAARNGEIIFGRNEPGLQHFHGQLARRIAEG